MSGDDETAFGRWPSQWTAAEVAAGRVSRSGLAVADHTVYWCESRPSEGGRQVVVGSRTGRPAEDLSPPGVSVRSRVHEYGGAAATIAGLDPLLRRPGRPTLVPECAGSGGHPPTPDPRRRHHEPPLRGRTPDRDRAVADQRRGAPRRRDLARPGGGRDRRLRKGRGPRRELGLRRGATAFSGWISPRLDRLGPSVDALGPVRAAGRGDRGECRGDSCSNRR